MPGPENKICKRCQKELPISEFPLTNYYRKDGTRTPNANCYPCRNELRVSYANENLEQRRYSNRRATLSKYGLSVEGYNELLESQNGVCAICQQPETFSIRGTVCELAVDHDHQTGKVRGLLCQHCNTAIGKFKEDPTLIRAAIDYLTLHQG